MKELDAGFIRVLGYFMLIAGGALFVLFCANVRSHFYTGTKYVAFLAYIAVYAVVVGSGLVRLRKWAAVALALPLGVAGKVLGTLTIVKNRTLVSSVLAVGWAALLCCPAVLAAQTWHELK